MRHNIKKDLTKRYNYKQLELLRLSYLALKNNRILNLKERLKAQEHLDDFNLASYTKIRNRCIITGWGRSVLRNWGISRVKFRELADQGYINGIKRASW